MSISKNRFRLKQNTIQPPHPFGWDGRSEESKRFPAAVGN